MVDVPMILLGSVSIVKLLFAALYQVTAAFGGNNKFWPGVQDTISVGQ